MSALQVAFVSHKLTGGGGGVAESVRCLAQAFAGSQDVKVNVFGLSDKSKQLDDSSWQSIDVHELPVYPPRFLGFSPRLRRRLARFDVVHTHGLWKMTSLGVLQWYRRENKPYLVAPHGMLNPLALGNSPARKLIARRLWENAHLSNASCLHALCESEAHDIQKFGCKNPICIIPNGVDLPPISMSERHEKSATMKLLYLGRIQKDKGLRSLIKAWSSFMKMHPPWQLDIVGWDDGGHLPELEELVKQLRLGSSVRFLGPRFGVEKIKAYQDSDAVILPSSFEALPMVVLEAWSYARPVLMTQACNLPIGFTEGAAIEVTTTADGVLQGLLQLTEMSTEDMREMGRVGRELAENRFAWQAVARDLTAVYKWVAECGEKPSTVI